MKKFLRKTAAVLAASLAVTGIAAVSAFAVVGDIDGNGKANASDARKVLRYAAKLETDWTEAQIQKADLNVDGKVNSTDARMLLRAAAKLDKLETYKNFYVEMNVDNENVALGACDGDIYMQASMFGPKLGIIIKANQDMVLVDDTHKSYSILTKKEMDQLMNAMQTSFDFSELTSAFDDVASSLPTPAALIDEGYTKGSGNWNGKTVTTFSKSSDSATMVYYYGDGMTILGNDVISGGNTTRSTYTNFTDKPQSIIYSYRNNYTKYGDFLEMILSLGLIDFG